MSDIIMRKLPLYRLVFHRDNLKRLESFAENVERCNFTTRAGWGGKTYVEDNGHNVEEYKPIAMRAVDVLNIYYIRRTDYVVLTEKQFTDYQYLMQHIDCIRTGSVCAECMRVDIF